MTIKLFLVDSDDLRRNLFEEVFGEQIYTLKSFEDASFRIPDFGPDIILIGQDMALGLSQEEMDFLTSSEIPFAAVCAEETAEKLKDKGWKDKFLRLPIDASAMRIEVETLLNQLRV